MSEETDQELEAIEANLQALLSRMQVPDLMTDYHHGETYFRGNQSGLVALALQAIRSSQGKHANAPYVRPETWNFEGFILDERMTVITTQKAQRRWKWNKENIMLSGLIALVAFMLVLGLITSVRWIFVHSFR